MVSRILGYQVLYLGTAAAGFLALALTGADVVTAALGFAQRPGHLRPGAG